MKAGVVVLEPPEKNMKYGEIYQQLKVKFSFVLNKGPGVFRMAFPYINCRDFLGDALWAKEKKKVFHLYGFSFNPEEIVLQPPCSLAVQFPATMLYENFNSNLPLLHKLEKENGFKPTKVFSTDKKNEYIVIGDKGWVAKTPLISFYTFLIKIMSFQANMADLAPETLIQVSDGNEKNYAVETAQNLPKFMANLGKLAKSKLPVDGGGNVGFNEVHYRSGFVAVCKGHNKPFHKLIIK